jgi:tRNA threonylcarbamoyladenosine dehydratase
MSRSSTLVLFAAAAIAAGATAIGYSQSVYNRRRSHLEKQVDSFISPAVDSAKQDRDDDDDDVDVDHPASLGLGFDEDLIQEFLARNYAFFGAESMSAIRKATVVVVGCGGVGSWAALMLLRRYLPVSGGESNQIIIFFGSHRVHHIISHAVFH